MPDHLTPEEIDHIIARIEAGEEVDQVITDTEQLMAHFHSLIIDIQKVLDKTVPPQDKHQHES